MGGCENVRPGYLFRIIHKKVLGKLIVLEGCEGSGKSTVISSLRHSHPEYIYTREPGGTKFSESVRAITLDKNANISIKTQLISMYAMRSDHLEKVILPALTRGQTVICDRFDLSTYAYQIGKNKGDIKSLYFSLRENLLASMTEVYYIILDINPEVGLARKKTQEEENFFETKPLAFHQGIRQGLLSGIHELGNSNVPPAGYRIIDANKAKEDLAKEVSDQINIWDSA